MRRTKQQQKKRPDIRAFLETTKSPARPIKIAVNNPVQEFRQYGYWSGPDFLPGMYVEAIDDRDGVRFRGLIAQGRVVYDRSKRAQKLTFITIGIANSTLLDLTINGTRPYWLFTVISGTGRLKSRYGVTSIDVVTSHLENF